MTTKLGLASRLALALLLLTGFTLAQNSGDTLQLAPSPLDQERVLVGATPDETNEAILDALNPVPQVTEPLTHGGTDQAAKQTSAYYKRQSELGRAEARGMFKGKGKGAQVNAYRDQMTKRSSFFKRLGIVTTVAEWWGTAWEAAGRVSVGDNVGAATVVTDKGLETGAAFGGGAVGGLGGPVTSVVGSAAAVEGYKRFVSPELTKWEHNQAYEARKATHLGTRQPKRVFSGTWRTEEASGTISLTKQGAEVRATIAGTYGNSRVSGSGGGKAEPDGTFRFTLSGSVVSTGGGEGKSYPYGGSISGTVSESGGSGRLSGANQYGAESGTWTAGG